MKPPQRGSMKIHEMHPLRAMLGKDYTPISVKKPLNLYRLMAYSNSRMGASTGSTNENLPFSRLTKKTTQHPSLLHLHKAISSSFRPTAYFYVR